MFEDIAAELEVRTFEEGDVLLEEGMDATNVYILKEGAVVVTIDGNEVNRVCAPETVFGEVAVLLESELTATVKALETTAVWVIEDLGGFMDTHSTFAKNVARELARRLCNVNFSVLEMRASLEQMQNQQLDAFSDEPTAELNKADTALLRFEAKNPPAEEDKQGEETAGKRMSITALLKKVDEVLHKRIF